MYNRTYQHFKGNDTSFNNSTHHTILNLADGIQTPFEKGPFTLGVFIDLKVFDNFNYSILLHKLELYRIKGKCLNLFQRYLKHLQQFVLLGKNENSIFHTPGMRRRSNVSIRSHIGRDVADHAETSSRLRHRYVSETDLFETSLRCLTGTQKKPTDLRRQNDVPIDT